MRTRIINEIILWHKGMRNYTSLQIQRNTRNCKYRECTQIYKSIKIIYPSATTKTRTLCSGNLPLIVPLATRDDTRCIMFRGACLGFVLGVPLIGSFCLSPGEGIHQGGIRFEVRAATAHLKRHCSYARLE